MLPRKPRQKQAATFSLGTAPDALELWPNNDVERPALEPGPWPGTAVCPTCHRALFAPEQSALLDLVTSAQDALRALQAALEAEVVP